MVVCISATPSGILFQLNHGPMFILVRLLLLQFWLWKTIALDCGCFSCHKIFMGTYSCVWTFGNDLSLRMGFVELCKVSRMENYWQSFLCFVHLSSFCRQSADDRWSSVQLSQLLQSRELEINSDNELNLIQVFSDKLRNHFHCFELQSWIYSHLGSGTSSCFDFWNDATK